MDPEIRHLRAICAIAEAGSLSRAAGQLGISQPALSGLLQRIERALGGQLFLRGRTGVQPTALGERAIIRARLVLCDVDDFIGDLARTPRPVAAIIRMGACHLACLGTMMRRLHEVMPDAEFTLQVEPSAIALAQSLAHRRLDIALVGMMDDHAVPLATDLAQRTLIPRMPVFVAVAADHRLAAQSEINLADLAGESWICPPGADDGSLASLRAACRRVGFEPRVSFQVPSGGAHAIIAAGQAVRLVEPSSPGWGDLAIRRLAGDPLGMRLVLAWHRHRITDSEAAQIYQTIARAYTDHVGDNPGYAGWWAAHPDVHPHTD